MIETIRKKIKKNIGKDIIIKVIGNRNRIFEYTGKIDSAYNNIFTVIIDGKEIKSFSYVDILIGNLRIKRKK